MCKRCVLSVQPLPKSLLSVHIFYALSCHMVTRHWKSAWLSTHSPRSFTQPFSTPLTRCLHLFSNCFSPLSTAPIIRAFNLNNEGV